MFDEKTIEQVWKIASTVEGFNPEIVRKDACGAWIMRNQYGNRNSIFGWEVDHVYPLSMGGDDNIINLRAMQWENNLSKGDDYPVYKSRIQAEGNKNIYKEEQYTVNNNLQSKLKQLYNLM